MTTTKPPGRPYTRWIQINEAPHDDGTPGDPIWQEQVRDIAHYPHGWEFDWTPTGEYRQERPHGRR